MNGMKKIVSTLFAGVGLVAPLMASSGVYATDPQITINNGAENLYVASGSQSNTDSTAIYDSSNNTLTLNRFNGDDISISGLASITIKLTGENTLSMNTTDGNNIPRGISAPNTELLLSGTGSLTVDQSDIPGFSTSAAAIYAGSITVESATLNIKAPLKACLSSLNNWMTTQAVGDITINSGNLSLACNTAMHSKNIVINGGVLDVDGKLSSLTTMSKNLTINDGKLTINAESINLGSAVTFYGSVEINGGETNIHGGQYGIEFTNRSGTLGSIGHFSISGGVLNIDNAQNGIYVDDANTDSYMEFIGGTTTIDAEYGVAKIIYGAENDKNIILGDKMFLSPNGLSVEMEHKDYSGVYEEYIYYLASNGSAAKSVVITDQESKIPDADDEEEIVVPDTGATEQEETNTKAPETGFNTDNQNYLVATIIVLPVLLGTTTGVRYFVRSRKSIKLDY